MQDFIHEKKKHTHTSLSTLPSLFVVFTVGTTHLFCSLGCFRVFFCPVSFSSYPTVVSRRDILPKNASYPSTKKRNPKKVERCARFAKLMQTNPEALVALRNAKDASERPLPPTAVLRVAGVMPSSPRSSPPLSALYTTAKVSYTNAKLYVPKKWLAVLEGLNESQSPKINHLRNGV